jgi:hypothetical protein
MDLKRFLFIFALLAMATSLVAQPSQAPPRIPPPPSPGSPANNPGTPPVVVPARPAGAARAPLGPPAPGAAPAIPFPSLPGTTPPAANPSSSAAATNTGTNSPDGDKADISYNFPAITVPQLLDIYADLVGRTMLFSSAGTAATTSTPTFTIETEGPLTRAQAIVALETVLGMHGIAIVPIGDKFAKVVFETFAPNYGGHDANKTTGS